MLYIPIGGVFSGFYSNPKAARGVRIDAKKKRNAVFPIDVPMKAINLRPSMASSSLSSHGLVLVS